MDIIPNEIGCILVEKEKVVVNTLEKKKPKKKITKTDTKFY